MRAKVLVTGGAGYIGSHACKALARAGYEPVVFDNLSTGWAGAVKWGPLVKGDLLDRASIDAALAEHRHWPKIRKRNVKSRPKREFGNNDD